VPTTANRARKKERKNDRVRERQKKKERGERVR